MLAWFLAASAAFVTGVAEVVVIGSWLVLAIAAVYHLTSESIHEIDMVVATEDEQGRVYFTYGRISLDLPDVCSLHTL